MIRDNPLLEAISFTLLGIVPSFEVINNPSVGSINLLNLAVSALTIEDHTALVDLVLGESSSAGILIIDANPSLKHLDGLSGLVPGSIEVTKNSQLRFYCGLRTVILDNNDVGITNSGNIINPTEEEILLRRFVRQFCQRSDRVTYFNGGISWSG
jgi:hypothetical protein